LILTPYWAGYYARLFKRIDPRYTPKRGPKDPERLEQWRDGYRAAVAIEKLTEKDKKQED